MDYPWRNDKYEVYMLPETEETREMELERVRVCKNSFYQDEGKFICELAD